MMLPTDLPTSMNRLIEGITIPEMGLTKREKEILGLILCSCYTNQEVADKLCISIDTTKTHVKNLCKKMGVTGGQKKIRAIAIAYLMIRMS